ncbi:hypothetical protein B0T14DRAFT_517887 [Immersiella caudata]|uniref:Uncharacterized protein n=1 Tax=Immersiella caudata TaxID=314043 RepID=A0AA40C445_9PEZI|nr:hypothetical protein B0T14DRAFT_517887 [Immersiella caudata]
MTMLRNPAPSGADSPPRPPTPATSLTPMILASDHEEIAGPRAQRLHRRQTLRPRETALVRPMLCEASRAPISSQDDRVQRMTTSLPRTPQQASTAAAIRIRFNKQQTRTATPASSSRNAAGNVCFTSAIPTSTRAAPARVCHLVNRLRTISSKGISTPPSAGDAERCSSAPPSATSMCFSGGANSLSPSRHLKALGRAHSMSSTHWFPLGNEVPFSYQTRKSTRRSGSWYSQASEEVPTSMMRGISRPWVWEGDFG